MKNDTSVSNLILTFSFFIGGIFLLAFYFLMNLDNRWLVVSFMLLITTFVFHFQRYKHIFLLNIMIFFIPYSIGFIYSLFISSDIVYAFDVVLYLLYMKWIIDSNFFQKGNLCFHRCMIPCFLMIIWGSLSSFTAMSGVSAGLGSIMLFKAVLVFVYLVNRITQKKELMAISNMLVLILAIQGVIGIAQRIKGHAIGLFFLGEVAQNMTDVLSRVRGTLGFPNQYGAFLILCIPMAMSLFIINQKPLKKIWYGLAALGGMLGLFFSLSRSAWLGMVCAVCLMVLLMVTTRKFSSRRVLGIAIIIMGGLLITYAYYDIFTLRLETGGTRGQNRLFMIQVAISIIKTHPVLGVGLFNYQYHSHHLWDFWHPVHNTYLRLASEIGIPGLLFFLWFLFEVFREIYRSLRLRDRFLNIIGLGVVGGLSAFCIAIMFGPQYQHYRQKFIFWVLAGMAIALRRVYGFHQLKINHLNRRENHLERNRNNIQKMEVTS